MTKIICTIGPATSSEAMLEKLIKAGMSIARWNLCHGTHEGTKAQMQTVQNLRKKLKTDTLIALDTKGPDVRIGTFKDPKVDIVSGQTFTFYCGEEHKNVVGTANECWVPYEKLPKIVKVGAQLCLNDGHVVMDVTNINGNVITAKVVAGGVLKDHKSLAAPGYDLELPFISEYDIPDLKLAVEVGVDMIMASAVSKPQDLIEMREWLDKNGGKKIQLMAKIEDRIAMANLDKIIELSDYIMVARGGLGTDVGLDNLAPLQKQIVVKTRKSNKPVVVATEMLESMTEKPNPTRAEASDVFNAIWDGASYVMLSGESTIGKFPVECVEFLSRVIKNANKFPEYFLIK